MATLVLGTLGTLVGGPVGGAIGALAGRQLDGAIIGGGSREGPRLKDLSLSTSSYGTPIPRHFGRMRVAGSIIWATELKEASESSGGGKGAPSTKTFSYSTSFAIALSSRPILDVGRIWADGNLLRGNAADLKTGGVLRIYTGHGDQLPDPLIEAAQNGASPAFRNCAYVVFEDLQLADFGNRIPALTFELFADASDVRAQDLLGPIGAGVNSSIQYTRLAGASDEGGPLAVTLETLGTLYPLAAISDGDAVELAALENDEPASIILPPAIPAIESGDFGQEGGHSFERRMDLSRNPDAVRYYDTERDYQPGIQRALGSAAKSNSSILEFPASLHADAARHLIGQAKVRSHWGNELLRWRIADLDTSIRPGDMVRAPGVEGQWIISSWEWRENGVELQLHRAPPISQADTSGDSGGYAAPVDSINGRTIIRAFELPWDGVGSPYQRIAYAAVGSDSANWSGAALYSSSNAILEPVGPSGRQQSTIGELVTALPASPALMLERQSVMELDVLTAGAAFTPASAEALAMGQNRMIVGNEIVQFSQAEQISETRWLLMGLLRGRGGTEAMAGTGHAAGTSAVLLNDRLIALDPATIGPGIDQEISAIGLADDGPVSTPIAGAGSSTNPLPPVHPHISERADGGLQLCWTRRARGAWRWPDGVGTPLHEEFERYVIGIGDPGAPLLSWNVSQPDATISASQRILFSGSDIWARQIGQFGQSDTLLITTLS